jgi:alpha-amylase/alpha-mannosidase (GH57 family)
MIDPLPELKSLIDMVRVHQQHTQNPRDPHIDGQYHANELCINYLNDQFYIDLLMWYHLAWMGAVLREEDERIQQLMAQKHRFDASHQRLLAEVMADAICGVIPRYKALQDNGQIELSMSPYGHPIVPLLIDFKSALDAMPDALLPQCPYYPDGYERAKWHLEHGVKVHERYFGQKPQGVWLSEGAVSTTAVGLLDQYDFKWTASGEGVWRHSVEASRLPMSDISSKRALYQPLQTGSQRCALFFRDDGLSDLIGFQYKSWAAEDAAANFVHNIENIARFLGDEVEERTVSVILDGENAWEYYPNNGRHFLEALYRHLAQSELVEMTTFSDALAQGAKVAHLPVLRAGSWVYGSFSTWIGDPEKNIAWDLLCEAKQTYDKVLAEGKLDKETRKKATEQLAICEGSDWFWWFGDYNPSDSVRDFDALYRRHLQRLYEILGETPPEILHTPISLGGGEMEQGGVMQRGV